MGQEILYCVACQTQLRGTDFDKRRAVRVDGKGYCFPCGEKMFPPDRLAASVSPSAPPPSTRLNIKPLTRRAPSPVAAPSLNRSLAIGGAAVLVAIGIGIALLSGGSPPPTPPPAIVPPPVAAKKAVDPTPPPLPDAAGLDAELQNLLPKEEFGQALRLIESARSLSRVPEWTRMLSQRSDDVHARVEKALKEWKAKAVEAKRAGNLEEPPRIRERLAKWEDPRALADFDAALAVVHPVRSGKILVAEEFSAGPGKFTGGEVVNGALAVPPTGVQIPEPFGPIVQPTGVVRFRVKPPPVFTQLELMIWSNTLKANCWVHVTGLKTEEWQSVEVKASEFKVGWARTGASVVGHENGHFKIYFDTTVPTARVLIDDFEVRE